MDRIATSSRLLALGLALLVHQGCKNQEMKHDWGWNTQRPAGPLQTFSHDLHAKVFERQKVECVGCHSTMAPDDAAFLPGKESCHVCHYNPQAGNTAPDRCVSCHLDVRAVEPANHNFDWLKRHAVFAKADNGSCEGCHRPRFCEDCHNRRDETTRTFHDRNIRFVHGIEARANPMKCGQCHTPNFCESCHAKGGFER